MKITPYGERSFRAEPKTGRVCLFTVPRHVLSALYSQNRDEYRAARRFVVRKAFFHAAAAAR